jgi:hypothetical protein
MTHITIEREALQTVLEALETCDGGTSWADPYQIFDPKLVEKAITAIKQARAAPVQEPVAWAGHNLDDMCEAFDRVIEEHASRKNPFHDPVNKDAMIALRILRGFVPYMKRYTTPPAQRQWTGLTDEEIIDMYNEPRSDAEMIAFGREVETKLKEKNT